MALFTRMAIVVAWKFTTHFFVALYGFVIHEKLTMN
jgi:hypothetical protein